MLVGRQNLLDSGRILGHTSNRAHASIRQLSDSKDRFNGHAGQMKMLSFALKLGSIISSCLSVQNRAPKGKDSVANPLHRVLANGGFLCC
jgi:hypothetical protein